MLFESLNKDSLKSVTAGSVTVVKLLQSENAPLPIDVNSGNEISEIAVPLNALTPTFVTESAVTEESLE